MKTASYARYSTDMQRETSLADQFRNIDQYAEREGWPVPDRFADEGLSGHSELRPGYQRLLADLKTGKFDTLLVDDLDRLSREDVRGVVRRLKFLGVRVIGVSDGFDSTRDGAHIQTGARVLVNDIALEDLRARTRRGLTGQALAGHNCGGRSYGYRHIPVEHDSRVDQYGRPLVVAVRREIDPDQADTIRWIFSQYVSGLSPAAIAAELNRRGVPSPRGGTWARSAIYGDRRSGCGILNNPLYAGKYIWNRSRWERDPDNMGKRRRFERPKSDWITQEIPELRIIDEATWQAAQARQAAQRQRVKASGKARHNPPHKYLFSGLLACGQCGAGYIIVDRYRYGCAAHKDRGSHICANDLKVARETVERCLLAGIKRELVSEDAITLFRAETARLLRATRDQRPQRTARLRQLDTEIANMIDAIRQGAQSAALADALAQAEAERDALARETPPPENILPRAIDKYRAMVEQLEGVIKGEDVQPARETLKQLLGMPIRLHPTSAGYLEAELTADYGGLIGLQQIGVVAGACYVANLTRILLK